MGQVATQIGGIELEEIALTGIFQDVESDQYRCLICQVPVTSLNSGYEHAGGRTHKKRLETIQQSCKRKKKTVSCKVCDFQGSWRKFLDHVHEKTHKRNLAKDMGPVREESSEKVDTTLVQNMMYKLQPGHFFCKVCDCALSGEKNVPQHVKGANHLKLLNEEKASQKALVDNMMITCKDGNYHCNACDCTVPGKKNNMLQHVNGANHLKLLNEERAFKKKLMDNLMIQREPGYFFCKACNCTVSGEKNVPQHAKGANHLVLLNEDRAQREAKKSKKSANDVKSASAPSNAKTDLPAFCIKAFAENSVTAQGNGWYYCVACSCRFTGWQNAMEHILAKKHQGTVENASAKLSSKLEKSTDLPEARKAVVEENGAFSLSSGTGSVDDENETPKLPLSMAALISNGTKPSNTDQVIASTIKDDEGNKKESTSEFFIPKEFESLIPGNRLQRVENKIHCSLCNVTVANIEDLMSHIHTKKHRKSLTGDESELSPCELNACGEKNIDHPSCQKHVKNVLASNLNDLNVNSKLIVSKDVAKPMPLQRFEDKPHCPLCNVTLVNLEDLISHTQSKQHYESVARFSQGSREGDSIAVDETMIVAEKDNSKIAKANGLEASGSNKEKPQEDPNNRNVLAFNMRDQSGHSETSKDITNPVTLEEVEDEMTCAFCNVTIDNLENLISHSQKHCEALTVGEPLLFETKKDNSKIATILEATSSSKEKPQPNTKNLGELVQNDTITYCSHCKVTMQDERTRIDHLNGQKHAKNLLTSKMKELNLESSEENAKPMTNGAGKISKGAKASNEKQRPETKQKRIRRRVRLGLNPKQLTIDLRHIYNVDNERLRQVKISCELSFPKTATTVYCLICEKSVESQFQIYYEHICSAAHTHYLQIMEQDDLKFENYREQFSDMALAKEFMQETSDEIVQCFACDLEIANEDTLFHPHVSSDEHKVNWQRWRESAQIIQQSILTQIESSWYNVQKYWCQPCNKEFFSEISFAEHLNSDRHEQALSKLQEFQNRLIYDSCAPCAILWLGFAGIYSKHCEEKLHKYMVKSGDYTVREMPRRAKVLLDYAEEDVMDLIAQCDKVLTVESEKTKTLLRCLEDAVIHKFPKVQVHAFGSRISGLGLPESDIDVFLDCGDMYSGKDSSEDRQKHLIKTVQFCLCKEEENWEIEEVLLESRTPIIKLRHRITELRCDVSVKHGLSVENTKLLKAYIDMYPPCRKLMLIVKKWLSMCDLSGSHAITNYAICWYVVFYLQWKGILPSVAHLIRKENDSRIIAGWETGVSHVFSVDHPEPPFLKLLCDFFAYYAEFDYRYMVASPLLGSTIEKSAFGDPHLFPQEIEEVMAPYIRHIETAKDPELFRTDSAMCIQDPFDLSHNLTKAVKKFTLNKFRQYCAVGAETLGLKLEQ